MGERNDMYRVMAESNNLGILFCRQGNYRMSVMFHMQALKIAEIIRGKLSEDYCDSLYNLGNTCAEAGDYNEALRHLLAAQQNAIMRGATEDIKMVHLLNSIAYATEALGDYPEAVRLLENAQDKLRRLSEQDEALQKDVLLRNTYYLAGVCEKSGELEKGLKYYEEALELIKKTDARYYPSCLNNIANLLAAEGNLDKSLEFRIEAVGQIKTVIGSGSISYAQGLKNLAVIFKARGDYARAAGFLHEAVEIKTLILGYEKDVLEDILILIELYISAEETDKALDIFINLLDRIDSLEDDETAKRLAKLYMSMGDINKLNEIYTRMFGICPETPGEDETM